MSCGLDAKARASATRWRMPPDSSCGYAYLKSVSPEAGRAMPGKLHLVGMSLPSSSRGSRTFVQSRPPGRRRSCWNTAASTPRNWSKSYRAAPADRNFAARPTVEADQDVEKGGLAAAGLADDGDHLPLADTKIEPVDRHHLLEPVPGWKALRRPETRMSIERFTCATEEVFLNAHQDRFRHEQNGDEHKCPREDVGNRKQLLCDGQTIANATHGPD